MNESHFPEGYLSEMKSEIGKFYRGNAHEIRHIETTIVNASSLVGNVETFEVTRFDRKGTVYAWLTGKYFIVEGGGEVDTPKKAVEMHLKA